MKTKPANMLIQKFVLDIELPGHGQSDAEIEQYLEPIEDIVLGGIDAITNAIKEQFPNIVVKLDY